MAFQSFILNEISDFIESETSINVEVICGPVNYQKTDNIKIINNKSKVKITRIKSININESTIKT